MEEGLLLEKFEKQADLLTNKYEDLFSEVSTSFNFKHESREFTRFDAYQLGTMIESYKQYESYVNENASASDLGTLPSVAVDLIAVSYALSVAPLLASIQTLGEQQGIIYFKQVSAVDTRRNITAGDIFAEAKVGIVNSLDEYGAEFVEGEDLGDTGAATTSYSLTLANVPIRSNIPVTITIAATTPGTITGTVVDGVVLSSGGMTGTLNYTTGALELELTVAPGNTTPILVSYHQDFEKADDVPEIEMTLTSTDTIAEVLALKQKISTLKAFQFNKRFGRIAEDEALQDLAGAMADIESRKVIKKFNEIVTANANSLTFDATIPTGVSEYEHRQAFKYVLSRADSQINRNAGRGYANRYIAGHGACEYIASLPKFVRATNNIAVGPHVFGYLDGVPVVRTVYVADSKVIGLYLNPQSPFEAPVVCATYMPVFITSTMQVGENPLQNQRAIASWKAFKSVVPQFVQDINITNLP